MGVPGDADPSEDIVSTPDAAATPERDAGADVTEAEGGLARGKIALLAGVALLGYGLDQLTKAWAVSSLEVGVPHDFIGSLLRLRRTSNPGAAFSIATNATWVLTAVACCVIVATIYIARKLRSRAWACALGLLIGGALGNLTDRFFREPGGGKGHVVDFLELPNWPIFNVADMCIVSAAVLICILAFIGIGVDGTRADDDEDADADDTAADDHVAEVDVPAVDGETEQAPAGAGDQAGKAPSVADDEPVRSSTDGTASGSTRL